MDVAKHFQVEQSGEAQPGEQLRQKIADRERRLARPAAAAQQPVAHEWEVVVPPYRLEAVEAVRTRPEDTLLVVRDADDADVEEAADGGAEQEDQKQPDAQQDHEIPGGQESGISAQGVQGGSSFLNPDS